jgi:hypothetical protein
MPADKYVLRRRATKYVTLLAQFERVKADLLKRRATASGAEMAKIEDRLQLNELTLKSVREELRATKEEIERLELVK